MKMITKFCLGLLLACMMSGCGPRYVDFFPCYDDGTQKPVVAFVPVIDRSGCVLPWDLSQELTEGIRYQLMCRGDLYIPPESEVSRIVERNPCVDFFGKDISFARNFKNYEFVAFIEVLQHEVVPYQGEQVKASTGQICDNVLIERVRLRVIDVRCDTPTVVLQEILRGEYKIANGLESIDYADRCWGSNKYPLTPMCKAHQRLVENIASKLEDATWSVR